MSWFEFLIARWEVLPEDIHQQLKVYDQLEKAAKLQAHRSLLYKDPSLRDRAQGVGASVRLERGGPVTARKESGLPAITH